MKIKINKKTLSRYPFNFSNSGSVIDELAFCAGEWQLDDVIESNLDYIGESITPYNFNFERDLLENTKTITQLRDLSALLEIPVIIDETSNLQAGAFLALNYPDAFKSLLEAYISALEAQRPGGDDPIVSVKYQKELEENESAFYKQQTKEWLHGDYRDYQGVIALIAKYFTESRNAGYYNESLDEYTFTIPDEEAKEKWLDYTDERYSIAKYTRMFIESIIASGNKKAAKAKEERAKRLEENKKTRLYKEERAKREAEERKIMLNSLINK